MPSSTSIPIIAVCGFLGSGKTTLLRRIRDRAAGRSLLFLVNDFPPQNVDGRRLEIDDAHLVSIAGGSVFCRCKAGDFLAALRRIAELDPAPDAVVIEASGIANPKAFGHRIGEFGLADRFHLHQCICLAEPAVLVKLRFTLPVVRDQLEAADLVLLNKADISSKVDLRIARDYVRQVNPAAAVRETVHADGPLDPFPATAPRDFGDVPGRDDARFATVTAAVPGPVDWDRLRGAFDDLSLHRVKGLVATADGEREVDWTHAGGWSLAPARRPADPLLVFVVAREDRRRAEDLSAAIAGGGYGADDAEPDATGP